MSAAITRHPDRSEAKWDLLFCERMSRSRSASLREAPVGMTGLVFNATGAQCGDSRWSR